MFGKHQIEHVVNDEVMIHVEVSHDTLDEQEDTIGPSLIVYNL